MLLQPGQTGFIDMHTEQARKTEGWQCGMNAKCTAAYTMVALTTHKNNVYFSDKQKPRLSQTDIQIKKADHNRWMPGNALGVRPMVFHGQI